MQLLNEHCNNVANQVQDVCFIGIDWFNALKTTLANTFK